MSSRTRSASVSARPQVGRAGQASAQRAAGRQQVLGEADAVPAQQTLDRVAVLRADLAQNDVLARHQDRVAAEALDDLAQRGADA